METFNFDKTNKFFDDYLEKVENEAFIYFNDVFKPFLIKHNLSFVSGMGSFWIGSRKGVSIDIERIKKFNHIYEMLAEQIPGTNNCLAEFMPDFRNEKL